MFIARPDRINFSSGEVSDELRAAEDLQRHRTGLAKLENMFVTAKSILTRRPGTRFVRELRTQSEAGKMAPYRYEGNDYSMLLFNGGKMRLGRAGGIVESAPGTPFELTVPWVAADMANLRTATNGNRITQTCKGKQPQVIARAGALDFSIGAFLSQNGPVDTQNTDTAKTLRVSALTGAIALTGSGNPLDSGWVGGVIRIDEANQAIVPPWEANESIAVADEDAAPASGYLGDMTDPADAFDAGGSAASKALSQSFWIGRSFSAPTPLLKALIRVPQPSAGGGTMTLSLYAKQGAAPAGPTDGTRLAQLTYNIDVEAGSEHTLTAVDAVTAWSHIWFYGQSDGPAADIEVNHAKLRRLKSEDPVLRRWQRNVYQAIVGGSAGSEAPVHTEGDVRAVQDGVVWRFLHNGGGFVRLDAVASGNSATGTVLTRLPESTIAVASYRWSPPAWGPGPGWPEGVQTFKQRYGFYRKNTYWYTKPGTADDFELRADAESAIARRLVSNSGSLVDIQWAIGKSALLLGTRDGEWITRAPKSNEEFSALNIDDDPETEEGSAPQIPAPVDRGVVFIGRSRQRLHYAAFARLPGELTVKEISIASSHIFGVGAVGMAWQRDPHRILWIHLADGTLAAATLMEDEKILAFHRHPMVNCFVEDLAAIPTLDDGKSELWLQTRRVIGGAVKRYYEILTDFFAPADPAQPTAAGAWFVDCGIRYQGAPASVITGLSHLEGQLVRVFADGAQQSDKTVSGGQVTLDYAASDVVVGLPIAARVVDLPRNIVNQQGTTKGLPQRASHIQVHVKDSVGGVVIVNDSAPEPISETGGADPGQPIALETTIRDFFIASESRAEVVVEILYDNAYPATVLGFTSGNEIEEGEA